MKKIYKLIGLVTISSFILPSCNNSYTGRIIFELNGGEFLDESFSTNSLVGTAGTPVLQTIPTPYKQGYYFVGWREKKKDGSYRTINQRLSGDGNSYYYYPYGTDTFYAYFEPLVTIKFDLGIGKEKGKLIEPIYDKQNFSVDTLGGYASKAIASVDYLPTVDASEMHLNFEYWYSEYPIVKTKDENNTEHYIQDKSQSKGIYQFDKGTFVDTMEFLLDDLTLYAYYQEDPTITIHFNIDGMENYSFKEKANSSIQAELTSVMKEVLNINYSISSERYYYPQDSKDYRFEGFYLDDGFAKRFSMDSSIYTESIDIYLKWSKRIKLNLDYAGGKVSDKETEEFSEYYESDILGKDFYDAHSPTKDTGSFNGYTLNEVAFDIVYDALPGHDITLVASYEEYPTLHLVYDYPNGYSLEPKENISRQIKPYSSIVSILDEFQNAVQEESLVSKEFYIIDDEGRESEFNYKEINDKSLTLYLRLEYRPILQIKTLTDRSSTYQINDDIPTISTYFKQGQNAQTISTSDILDLEDCVQSEDDVYLYDGLYSDETLTTEAIFPIYMESSHDFIPTLTLYRKMTKAIKLTFYYEGHSDSIGSIYVIPNSSVNKYISEITALVGNYSYLEIDSKVLSSIMPSADADVIVKGHNT